MKWIEKSINKNQIFQTVYQRFGKFSNNLTIFITHIAGIINHAICVTRFTCFFNTIVRNSLTPDGSAALSYRFKNMVQRMTPDIRASRDSHRELVVVVIWWFLRLSGIIINGFFFQSKVIILRISLWKMSVMTSLSLRSWIQYTYTITLHVWNTSHFPVYSNVIVNYYYNVKINTPHIRFRTNGR